jgi:hypothetical protein
MKEIGWVPRLGIGLAGTILILMFGTAGSACSPSESLTSVPVTGESFDSPTGQARPDTHRVRADGAIDLSVESLRPPISGPTPIVRATVSVVPPVPKMALIFTTTTTIPIPAPEPMLPDLYEVAGMIEELRVYLDLPDDRVYMARPPEPPQFTLDQLIGYFFEPHDRDWALLVAFCESSGQPDHIISDAVHHSSRASGWFQHLPKFWDERSEEAGFADEPILDPIANVAVASWLFYEGGGKRHWNESKACWGG